MQSIHVGPFAVSVKLGLFILAAIVMFAVGERVARRRGTEVERGLWMAFLVGLGSARLAYVLTYWAAYSSRPWSIFDIRDGGLNLVVGVAGGLLTALILAFRNPGWRVPLLAAAMSGGMLWGGAMAVLTAGTRPSPLPAIALQDLDGRTVRIDALRGKPVVINLWATWCPPCRREMPVLRDAQQQRKDVVFVFANQKEHADTVKAYLRSGNLQLGNVLLDPQGAIAEHAGSVALPTTLFYGSDGRLAGTRIGELSAATLAERLGSLARAP